MKEQLSDFIYAGYVIPHPLVFVSSITRADARGLYANGKTVLISDGVQFYEVKRSTVVQDWVGILFTIKN